MRTLFLLLPLLLIVGCSKPISEETLIDKDGLYTEWYENGNKKLEYTYNDGKMDGRRTFWYEDGQKRWLSSYKDGERDGPWTEWYQNGKKRWVGSYKNGKRDGSWTWWWEWTGDEKKFEKTYKDGNEVGKSIYYNEDGSVREVKDCDKGECDDY